MIGENDVLWEKVQLRRTKGQFSKKSLGFLEWENCVFLIKVIG